MTTPSDRDREIAAKLRDIANKTIMADAAKSMLHEQANLLDPPRNVKAEIAERVAKMHSPADGRYMGLGYLTSVIQSALDTYDAALVADFCETETQERKRERQSKPDLQ